MLPHRPNLDLCRLSDRLLFYASARGELPYEPLRRCGVHHDARGARNGAANGIHHPALIFRLDACRSSGGGVRLPYFTDSQVFYLQGRSRTSKFLKAQRISIVSLEGPPLSAFGGRELSAEIFDGVKRAGASSCSRLVARQPCDGPPKCGDDLARVARAAGAYDLV